ncbi:MAG: winged helix DNA-binding domain-containing protein [Eubacteriales bacterium]|nr:winged helix DNA-binding domain-containing protein [Eubacteriales bacterium]
MVDLSVEQIRNFRLYSHHLDKEYQKSDVVSLVGACGMQNSPPGAWETALYNRIPQCGLSEMEDMLHKDKLLLQAWSFRGAPVVFPVCESDAFLSSLIPEGNEPWIYTKGIGLGLEVLQMTLDELLCTLKQVMPRLDDTVIVSKTTLDQTLAQWMLPLLPGEKQELWNQPSMYGNPDKQTVGGAVVSFLLRPCAFNGLVVFGEREGISPSFTSYKGWTGNTLSLEEESGKKIVRKFLHCYGPATVDSFVSWLGCSGQQGRRMWKSISEETEPVTVFGKKAFILSEDRERLFSPESCRRDLVLLGGHDPYLDQRDRCILQPDKSLHKQIWRLVTNPGAVVYRGEVIGIWTSKKKGRGMEISMTLWKDIYEEKKLLNLAERYADFRQERIISVEIK